MRGSGKTTAAKLLAEKLNMKAVEMDALLEEQFGESIKTFVEKNGWPTFRKAESELVTILMQKDGQVISTGGGVILDSNNVEKLRAYGTVVLLSAPVRSLRARIGEAIHLPTLRGGDTAGQELEDVWNERRELYTRAAHFVVDTEHLAVEDVVAEVIKKLHA
ncbi:MAG: Shikimate kinase [Candidatus Parcubacteria bacterium]